MAEREGPRQPQQARDVTGEDFLFHLYRGSELLQDDRVHDAKAELEQALSLQPSDPKGQDLLGVVYFRLGLYPRAIAIYEELIQLHPDATGPRINLALSYLKTGQPARARRELERVVEQNPGHCRAWGYLGLAFQRLGDNERAQYAFSAGGHDGMARRVLESTVSDAPTVLTSDLPPRPLLPADSLFAASLDPKPPVADAAIAEAEPAKPVAKASELPVHSDVLFLEAEYAPSVDLRHTTPSAAWSRAPAAATLPRTPARVPLIAAPVLAPLTRPPADAFSSAMRAAQGPSAIAEPPPSSTGMRASAKPASSALEIARAALLIFPRDHSVALHPSGLVLAQAAASFVTRLSSVRSLAYSAGYSIAVLCRRTRGRTTDEPLGGSLSSLVEIKGKGELVLGPDANHRLLPMMLNDEPLYLREDSVAGFDGAVTYESGRLPGGEGDSVALVQLRGPGVVIASAPEHLTAVEVVEARTTVVRASSVVGWIGRLVPRALVAGEAPGGVRGFIGFSGEGTVLVHGV